jgi:predicted HTH domain antitoxin
MDDCPPGTLGSHPFVGVLAQAIAEGRVSVRRAAGLVGLTIEDLADFFRRHGVAAPFEP